MNFDPYEVLGVPRDADAVALKRAYRKLSKKWHPDRNVGDDAAKEQFERVARAYAILSDPHRRAEYDAHGVTDEPRRQAAGDPDQAAILGVLGQFLLQAIDEAERGALGIGGGPGVAGADLAARVRDKVREQKAGAEKVVRQGEKNLRALREAAGRFEVPPDRPDHAATVLNARIRTLEAEVARVKEDVEKFAKTLAWLDGVKYRRDGQAGGSAPDWRVLTAGPSTWGGWGIR